MTPRDSSDQAVLAVDSSGRPHDVGDPGVLKRSLLLFIPIAGALGSLTPVFGSLSAFRLFSVLIVGVVFLSRHKKYSRNAVWTSFVVLSILWLLMGSVGWVFAENRTAATRELAIVALGLVLIAAITVWSLSDRRVSSYLRRGWILAFVATMIIAIREVLTQQHLENYFPSTDILLVDTRLTASVFGNPNAYGVFLTVVFPIFAAGFLTSGGWRKLAYLLCCLATVPLMLSTGSRLGLLALTIECVVFVWYGGVRFRKTLFLVAIAGFIGFLVLGGPLQDLVLGKVPSKLESASVGGMVTEALAGGGNSSGGRRSALYLDGVYLFLHSFLTGVGPGNFAHAMQTRKVPYLTAGVVDPHNVYTEIAAQYGVVVICAFLFWLFTMLVVGRRAAKFGSGDTKIGGAAIVAALSGAAISGLSNSTYLPSAVNWVFFSTLMTIATSLAPALRAQPKRQPYRDRGRA